MASVLGDIFGGAVGALGNIIGGITSANTQENINEANYYRQKEFAKHGIQWKVEDAKAAGVHPLFALGANTTSFSNLAGDTSLGDAIGRAGQDIGRATSAALSADERAMQVKGLQLELENKGLQNDILRTEIASKLQRLSQGSGPPFPDGRAVATGEKVTSLTLGGKRIEASPMISDTQGATNRYGEMADYIWGPMVAVADEFRSRPRQIEGVASAIRALQNYLYARFLRTQERFR